MANPATSRIPRLTAALGRAVVHLDGQAHDCGRYGTPEALAAYDDLIATWLAHGRMMPNPGPPGVFTVDDLVEAYWRHAEQRHRLADGSEASELRSIRMALSQLRRHYGPRPAAEFGPLALAELRDTMAATPTRRGEPPVWSTVTGNVRRVLAAFRWGVAQELVPPSVYWGLMAVEGVRGGQL